MFGIDNMAMKENQQHDDFAFIVILNGLLFCE